MLKDFFCAVRARWRRFWLRQNLAEMLVCGGALLFAGELVRGICGSPRRCVALLQLWECLPPMWLLALLWRLWYFSLGALFGAELAKQHGEGVVCLRATERAFAGMLFVVMILLGFLWYPLFFIASRFFLCAVLAVLIVLLCVGCAWRYIRCNVLLGAVLLLHCAFLCWMLVLNLIVIFT